MTEAHRFVDSAGTTIDGRVAYLDAWRGFFAASRCQAASVISGSLGRARIGRMSDHDWVAVFTQEFEQPESAVQARIWADVFGDEYPAELAPDSYTTRSELQFVADALAIGSGAVLVDIGCGRGGPGLRVAASTGARYVGVDIAASALDAVALSG